MTACVISVVLVGTVATGSATASEPATASSVVIAPESNGDATVTVTHTFDLTTETEREAFETLEADAETRDATRDRFEDRMAGVAAAASDAAEREMTVENARIDLATETEESVGIVTLSVTWTALAEHDGDRLIITEPIASGTTFDQPLVIVAPDGYTLETATPAPDTADGSTMQWDAETPLDGFEATLATDEADDDTAGAETQPGFGPIAAVVALIGAMIGWIRR